MWKEEGEIAMMISTSVFPIVFLDLKFSDRKEVEDE